MKNTLQIIFEFLFLCNQPNKNKTFTIIYVKSNFLCIDWAPKEMAKCNRSQMLCYVVCMWDTAALSVLRCSSVATLSLRSCSHSNPQVPSLPDAEMFAAPHVLK